MKKYEITYLTKQEEGHDAKSIAPAFAEHKATIVSVHPWGARRKLVYPIKKEDQAFFTTVVFEADPSAVKPIETALQLNNDILRSLVVIYEPGIFDRSPVSEETTKEAVTPEETTPELAPTEPEEKAETTTTEEVAEEKPKRKRATKAASETAVPSESLDEKLDALLNEDITK